MIFTLSMLQSIGQEKPKLVYYGDPMCSWCYGFSPELQKVIDHYGENMDLEVVMGGLRPYNKQTMPELKEFLKGHWDEVHERSGQAFSYRILDESEWIYDTEPACRAIVAIRNIAPGKEMQFFKEAQTTFYYQNKNLAMVDSYAEILDKLKIDPKRFNEAFHSEEMKNLVRNDFTKAQEMGVRGFPSLMLEYKGELYNLANGYSTSEKIIQRIDKSIN